MLKKILEILCGAYAKNSEFPYKPWLKQVSNNKFLVTNITWTGEHSEKAFCSHGFEVVFKLMFT